MVMKIEEEASVQIRNLAEERLETIRQVGILC